jgi:hypothetical protein
MSTAPPQEAIVDERSRARRLAAPLAAAGGVLLATGYIRFVDPNEPGHYPMCPTLALLGIDCPGCGGLRATHALAHGDVAAALDHNAFFVVFVPVLVGLWVVWAYRAWTGVTPPKSRMGESISRAAPVVVLIVAMAFAVIRNFVPFLGSGVG